jgi:carbamoyl-phosphate synthase small subunit
MKAILALADGKVFHGESFGAPTELDGEVVFNTSMSGYQEILTDPSYCGQMVVMTYPLIGNYGINPEDFESVRPFLSGFIIKELSGITSNWRSRKTLDEFLKEYNIAGIQGIDTRALTRHIRESGAQQGVISTNVSDPQKVIEKARTSPGLMGRDLVREVTCSQSYDWSEGEWNIDGGYQKDTYGTVGKKAYRVIAYDFGIKRNILRKLVQAGCQVRVVPAQTTAQEVLAQNPNGVFLSNGPGDPEGVPYAIDNIKKLLGKVPIFGICLGHQIVNLALGSRTYKMKFGHHGGNQPVMNLKTRRVEITAQNHGFAVDAETAPDEIEITAINLNDRTVEGMRHKTLPVFSVQYHPEASPGPHDSSYLFHDFIESMRKHDKRQT